MIFFLGGSPENVRQAKVKTFLTNDSMDVCVCVFVGVNVCIQVVEPFWQEELRTNREELIQSVRWQNVLTHPTRTNI